MNGFRNSPTEGARVQRLLWASTSTKNPDYSDLKYVETLIGPDTINTVTVETLDAYRDHGEPKASARTRCRASRLGLAALAGTWTQHRSR